MSLRKIFLVLLFLIFVNASVFAAVDEILIESRYAYVNEATSVFFSVSAIPDSFSEPELLRVSSQKYPDGIDFNVSKSSGNFVVISFSAESASLSDGIPTIPVYEDEKDIVTISAVGGSVSDSFIVDAVKPKNSAEISVTPENANFEHLGLYYSRTITVDYSDGEISDAETFIDKHIVYLVPVSKINNYKSEYIKKYEDANTVRTKEINSLEPEIPDGNYYVVIDAKDIAGNYSDPEDVRKTKVNVYFDNEPPSPLELKINGENIAPGPTATIYTDQNVFDLSLVLSDVSGIASGIMEVYLPNGKTVSDTSYESGFLISKNEFAQALLGHTIKTNERFIVKVSATDNVSNTIQGDLNIVVDLTPPSTPKKNTLSIEDYNKSVTITWEKDASSDPVSGLKEYRVYKSTSNFSKITNQTLVCTTDTKTYTCKDNVVKDLGKTMYYGIVAVDNVGNISDANTQSIWTGPDNCYLKINNDAEFTNDSNVDLKIEYSRDINSMAISCNNGNPTATEAKKTTSFNLTTGSGCSTKNEEKTIYVKVISKNDPKRFSVCSSNIIFDNTAPTVPTDLKATTQADGSVKLTWSASTESVEPDSITYRIYYSTTNNVTNAAEYKETSSTNYVFRYNQDLNLYFKVSAMDLRKNESALSSAVQGSVRKIGPMFTINVEPSNDVNGEIYVNSGIKTIEFTSDEELLGLPKISIKKANSNNFIDILSTYDSATKKGSAKTEFAFSGVNVIRITGTNTKNEKADSELEIIMDNTDPDFNFSYNLVESTIYEIGLYDLPDDIFKVEYSVNDQNVIYFKQLAKDYNFSEYDFSETPDGNYTMYIHVYDKALNKKTKTFDYEIDLIDEDKVDCDNLRAEITNKIYIQEEKIGWFKEIHIIDATLEKTINDKKTTLLTKRSEGNEKYSAKNYVSAKDDYQFCLDELQAIDELIPEIEIIKTITLPVIYDANVPVSLEQIKDQNISLKTKELYDSNIIQVERTIDALKVNTQNYFSAKLTIKNKGTTAKEITIIENIPKSFAKNISKLIFDKEVEILVVDPVIKYTFKIPPNGSEELVYKSIVPVTADNVEQKYNTITQEFNTNVPLIVDGNISSEQLNIKKPINMQFIIYVIVAIFVIIIIMLIIGAINNYKNKKLELKPDSQKMMYDYFGKQEKETPNKETTKTEDTKNQENEDKSKKSESDKFNEDYQFILSAIKKR